eukprot:5532718-Amphidinium_carterae.1
MSANVYAWKRSFPETCEIRTDVTVQLRMPFLSTNHGAMTTLSGGSYDVNRRTLSGDSYET